MSTKPYLFVGAGPAALVLARALVRAFPERPLVLIDAHPPEVDRRTFAFWSAAQTPYDGMLFGRWSSLWVFGTEGERIPIDLGQASYRAFDMGLWRAGMRTWLERHGQVRWVVGRVQEVVDRHDHVEARSADGSTHRGELCFDSRYDPPPVAPDRLIQSFSGWWVRTETPRFTEGPTLMDFRLQEEDGVRFWYVLPASPERALVMAVTFDQRPHPAQLGPYAALLGLGPYRVERVEAGTLPMHTRSWVRRAGERQLRIGLAGGRLKPSTGYGLTRFVADAGHVVASLQEHGHPFDLPNDPRMAVWMDDVFIEGLIRHPDEAPAWFTALFQRVDPARLLRFLDGAGTLADLAAVASSLPLGRFLTLF